MYTSTGVCLLALATSALAWDSAHENVRRHHQMRRNSVQKRSSVTGIAYYGYQNNTENACGTVSKDSDFIVGVGPDFYGDITKPSDKCWQHITVSLVSDPTKSVDVTLTDACQNCNGPNNVYLSTAAFTALAGSLDSGVLDVTWEFVGDSTPSSSEAPPVVTSTTEVATPSSTAIPTTSITTHAPSTTPKATPSSTKKSEPAPTTTASSGSSGTSSDGWTLKNKLTGQSFIDFFNFDSGTSDNSGVADYVNGVDNGLVYVDGNGKIRLAVDTTEDVGTRKSVRMVSQTTFNPGHLFVFDIQQIPAVCGTWPAAWLTGANWPEQGEIDVVEGVNLYNKNIVSIHTGSGCTLTQSNVNDNSQATIVEQTGTNCDANSDPAACGFTENSSSSFGPGFNAAGGGVFAMQFTTDGIKVWQWNAGSAPSDATTSPTPSSWGAPTVQFENTSCDISQHFQNLMLIVNTNLGGTFTEGVWSVDGAGGQATSCATQTGFSTAASYIQSKGSVFGEDAQWIINGFYIFNN